ncbi:MAG: macro domain-containing protein [Candidatus Aminicenantales bacterium]
MIEITRGNLIETDAEALVNTVNCVGYMGKGIALQFKKAFPDNFKAYERACRANGIRPGKVFVFSTGSLVNPKYIVNFPTKRDWRAKSQIEDVRIGLRSLIEEIRKLGISSVALPPLGCGLGGLNWKDVKPLIEGAFAALPNTRVMLFEPIGTPDARAMPVRTKRPRMTIARALLIRLIHQYAQLAYRLTLLEVQKMAYFLQEAGEPLRLRYEAGLFGPYAHNLNKVLEIMEGHFIRGYGDTQKPDVEIELLPGAIKESDKSLSGNEASADRLKRVATVIEGFETPYGLELLSSVHWIAVHGETTVSNPNEAVRAVHKWNERKQKMFKPEHIHIAWTRLAEQGWLGSGKKT